ncbi:MAG: hypothetical protein JNK05_14970 [Myxococcales bacterium]|nr:hypothetical protein [Myxococcales bacterium]
MVRDKDDRDLPAKTSTRDDDRALDAHERKVLDEALSRGETVRKTVEDAVAEYGRWLFAQVFGGDTALVFDRRDEHPLWNAIVEASDGPRLRLTAETLERAVLCAAYDKRLNNDAWRALDYGRKSRLVRLEDDKLLRKAAQHVLATNMKTKPLEAYVRALLLAEGEQVQTRVTLGRVASQLEKLTGRFEDDAFLHRLDEVLVKADEEERASVIDRVDAMQRVLSSLRARVAKKPAAKPAKRASNKASASTKRARSGRVRPR